MDINQGNTGEEILYDLLTTPSTIPHSTFSNQDDFLIEKSKSESVSYLKELSSYNIHKLQLEPVKLKEEYEHINEEIQNLAFTNYKTFIRTAQCSREIYQDFNLIENKLDLLIDKLPEFTSKCENFTKNIQNINASRRINNLTLQKHNQLLEILEISQLMDTCVRNEYYEEALELASYVKRLEKKLSTQIPLIQQICDDVKQSLQLMLKQLLQQLKTNIQFPQCLKIIGLIRRLDIYNESQLRIKFLQLRDCWLQKLLENIPKDDTYHYICKTIDENRVHLFDIITQYKALFSDDDLTASTAALVASTTNATMQVTSETKLFNCWILDKITRFLNTLKESLQSNTIGNRLDSVLSQAMYFGLAFSRVGLDFRVLIVEIFETAAYEQLSNGIDLGTQKFEEIMSRFNINDLVLTSEINETTATSNNTSSITAAAAALLNNAASSTNSKSGGVVITPPLNLIEIQPLAVYLNYVLQGFNDFRLCAPLNLFYKIKYLLEQSLNRVSHLIELYLKNEQNIFDSNEKELINRFLKAFAYQLIPHVEKCFQTLFPIQQLQKTFAIQQYDMDKLKLLLKLNYESIIEPVKNFVPPKAVYIEPITNVDVVKEIETNDVAVSNDGITHEKDNNNEAKEENLQ